MSKINQSSEIGHGNTTTLSHRNAGLLVALFLVVISSFAVAYVNSDKSKAKTYNFKPAASAYDGLLRVSFCKGEAHIWTMMENSSEEDRRVRYYVGSSHFDLGSSQKKYHKIEHDDAVLVSIKDGSQVLLSEAVSLSDVANCD